MSLPGFPRITFFDRKENFSAHCEGLGNAALFAWKGAAEAEDKQLFDLVIYVLFNENSIFFQAKFLVECFWKHFVLYFNVADQIRHFRRGHQLCHPSWRAIFPFFSGGSIFRKNHPISIDIFSFWLLCRRPVCWTLKWLTCPGRPVRVSSSEERMWDFQFWRG